MCIKLFGTNVKISFLFVAFVTAMIFIDKTGLVLPLILAVSVHESAHLLMMKKYGVSPKEVTLIPGAIQIVNYHTITRRNENVILLAGPLSNLLLFLLFLGAYSLTKNTATMRFCAVQLVIFAFNLIVAKGLDGGTLFLNICAEKFGENLARILLNIFSFLSAFFIAMIGIYYLLNGTANISIFILAIYILVFTFIKN